MAQIYLDEEGTKSLARYEEALRKETDNFLINKDNGSVAFPSTDEFVNAYERCEEYFQKVLDPETLVQNRKDKW